MSTRTLSLIALVVVVCVLLVLLASYHKRVREEFVSDLRLCTFSDVLEPTLREFFSETNTVLLGTAANVYFDGFVKAYFTEYDRSDWQRTTRAVNDVFKVLLRGVDMARLVQLLRVVKRCVRQEIARVESVVAWLSNDASSDLSIVEVGRCVYDSLGRDDAPTFDDLYLMLSVVQRNARIVDLSPPHIPEQLQDLVSSLRGEIISRADFFQLLESNLSKSS